MEELSGVLRRLASGPAADGTWEAPAECLERKAAEAGLALDSAAFAAALDGDFAGHPSHQREAFLIPAAANFEKVDGGLVEKGADAIYLCGHSLGLQPKRTRELVAEELDKWAKVGVEGHWTGERPWAPIDECVVSKSAAVLGALPSEVAIMNGLTVNLHLLLVAFYRPEGKRVRILYESDAFPSDFHAFESQASFHGLDPKEVLLPVRPRAGEQLLRQEDVIKAIEDAGETLAVVVFGTVQYYTGQYFDIPALLAPAQRVGAATICQCAHAAGNVDLKLHEWGVDGAVWCSYKYMNSGPGGMAGFFIHEKHHARVATIPKFAGWWGNQKDTRFDMAHVFEPMPGAAAFQLSNPPVLQIVSLLASLDIFHKSSMTEIRGRSMLLTAFLEFLVRKHLGAGHIKFSVITPTDPMRRGAALSLKFEVGHECVRIAEELAKRGVVIDYRKPNVLRVAPAPLYNNFSDVLLFSRALDDAIVAMGEGSATKRQRVAA